MNILKHTGKGEKKECFAPKLRGYFSRTIGILPPFCASESGFDLRMNFKTAQEKLAAEENDG